MELLSHILAQGEVQITFPQQNEPFTQIVEGQCYQALCKIKAIIEDDRLNDIWIGSIAAGFFFCR